MGNAYAHSFRDLIVYQKARSVAFSIFKLTQKFPPEERYSLTDQMRRSSRSIGAQIAEAWAKRIYEKHFISKLSDADGEQMESQHWVETSHECSCISEKEMEQLNSDLQEIGAMLNAMMKKADSFCSRGNNKIQEPAKEYFVSL